MNTKLLLKSTEIFEDANIIDCIRQTCIALKNSATEDDVKSFLKESLKYLKDDLSFDVFNELFAAILLCFKYNRKYLSSFLVHFIKRVKNNSNYLIVTSFILSDFICFEPQLQLPEYEPFVEESLSSIIEQIQKDEENDLILFDHKISRLFKNELIVNLLLSSNLTEEKFLDFFPYLFMHNLLSKHPKFDALLQRITNNEIIHISKQTATSDNEICEFLESECQCNIKNFSRNAISLIESAVIFIKSQKQKKIKGLKKETILQFLAVVIVIIKNFKIQEKVTFSSTSLLELIIEASENLRDNHRKVLLKSIDLIVSNYFYINGTLSIPLNTLFKVFQILLQIDTKYQYHGDMISLLHSIFDLSDKIKYYNLREPINEFFETNSNLILFEIFRNIREIKKDYRFMINKIDMKFFDQNTIFSKNTYLNPIDIIYFLSYSCKNVSDKCIDEEFANQLFKLILLQIKEQKVDDAILIAKFMKKTVYAYMIESLDYEKNVPYEMRIALFGVNLSFVNSIGYLVKSILEDPAPEENDQGFWRIFNELIEDKKLFHLYLTLKFSLYSTCSSLNLEKFLKIFADTYNQYPNIMLEVVQKMFDYYKDEGLLIYKMDFDFDEKIQSEKVDLILSILYQEIEKNNKSYQAFYCLMHIAKIIPGVFASNPLKVFKAVYPTLDYLFYIFEKKEDEKHLPYIKAGYSALMFLISALQSTNVMDEYFKWLFIEIEKFSDTQVLCSFIILNLLKESNQIKLLIQGYSIKYNFFNTISSFLERKVLEGYFVSCYRENIYKFITDSYESYLENNMYIQAQIEELMKLENPVSFAFCKIHQTLPDFPQQKVNIAVNTHQLEKYIKNIQKEREFWLSYHIKKNLSYIRVALQSFNFFESKLEIKEPYPRNMKLPEVQKPITFRMARYVTMQKFWVYKHILYNGDITLTYDMFKYLKDVIDKMNLMKKDDEINYISFSKTDCLLSQYCQDSLIKSLINELFSPSLNDKCVSTLCKLFHAYASNDVAMLSLLSIISQCFTDIYKKCIVYAPPNLLKVLYDLIEILSKMKNIKGFKEIFFETCGNNLINIVLMPELRCDPILLWNVCKFFDIFSQLPIRVTQIIGFIIILDDEKVLSAGISLCQKFSYNQLSDINSIILNLFDNELKKGKRQSILALLINYSPSIIEKRKSQMYSILKGLLKKFVVQNHEKIIGLIGIIMSKLAPKRDNFDDFAISEGELTEIPLHIKERDQTFWNLFEKYMDPILKLINNDPAYLNKFQFLFDYPELISFKVRSLLVRKTMKSMIDQNEFIVLCINSKRIIDSSFQCMFDESRSNLLKKLYVIFDENKKTIDMGGPTRAWMSKLAKEIFNSKNGLFDCKKNMAYQPSSMSSIQPDYLKHFKFFGIFVARALIEGQCIEAHLTSPFIKQILHRKLTLKDLEDVDEQLFNSMTWLLNNNVDELEMYFEIDSEEFGVHKTIPLKTNGSQIKVTNENKAEFVELNYQYLLHKKIEDQVQAFCEGFDFLIPHEKINFFTPKEFDLLICGLTEFDIDDLIENTWFEYPYNQDHPVIQMFFKEIRSWSTEDLSKLLFFITGSRRIPANGFKEFAEITGHPLTIAAGGEENSLPKAHTCFNMIDLPSYSNEVELRNKLRLAINECDSFGLI